MTGHCPDCGGTECWCPKPPTSGAPTVTFNGWTYTHDGERWVDGRPGLTEPSTPSNPALVSALNRILALENELARKRYWITNALRQIDEAVVDLGIGLDDQFTNESEDA